MNDQLDELDTGPTPSVRRWRALRRIGVGLRWLALALGTPLVALVNGTAATPAQQAYLKASNTGAGDYFGHSVAVSGAAYIFVRNGTTWRQQAYLKASNAGGSTAMDYGDDFGRSVAVSGDTEVVGAPGEDSNASGLQGNQSDNSATNSGAAYVFVRSGTNWSQWVVLQDFLPTIVSEGVLSQVLPHLSKKSNTRANRPQIEFFHWRNAPFLPLEFSAAAYRFGHSMVRPGYRLSETIGPVAIFDTDPNKALTGFREFPDNWAIDWNLFINLEPRDPDDRTRTQLAYKIDTSLVIRWLIFHHPSPSIRASWRFEICSAAGGCVFLMDRTSPVPWESIRWPTRIS